MKKSPLLLVALSLLLSGCNVTPASPSVNTPSETPSIPTPSVPSVPSTPSIPSTPIVHNEAYNTHNGSFDYGVNEIVSKDVNSLCLVPNKTLQSGTLSVNVSNFGTFDNGIVFLVNRGNKQKFFEGEGISYYFFFVSNAGTLYLGKSFDGGWTNLAELPINGFDKSKNYDIKVSFEKNESYIQFHCYLNEKYYYSTRDYETNVGSEFGLRAGGKDVTFNYLKSFNEVTNPSRYQVSSYFVGNGSFDADETRIYSSESNSIAYKEDEFALGTLSVDMIQSGIASDSGIIFGLERNGNINFWEENVSYYFFFINFEGHPYLGKVNNGSWTSLYFSPTPLDGFKFDVGSTNNLKIERTATTIKCFVDNVQVCEYIDKSPLLGKEYGFRVGVSTGLAYENLSVTKTGDFDLMQPTDYEILKGNFISTDNTNIMSSLPLSLALHKSFELTEGTLSLKLVQGSSNETGVIFRSNNSASSYYLFSVSNGRTHLFKVTEGSSVELTPDEYLSAGYNSNTAYDTKIVIKGNTIYCYFSGILYATYTDNNMLTGNKVGLHSKAPYASFSDVSLSVTPEVQTAKTLVIGHSYMELWTNYKNDLSNFEDVYNIGIGGSVSFDWNDMEENVAAYSPTTLIFMIGINDFPRGLSPEAIANNVRTLLINLKAKVPTLEEVALVSINRCVTHDVFRSQIETTNNLYRNIVNDLSYVHYADVDNAFLTNGTPDAKYFTDGLHPTAASYSYIVDAIEKALGR